MQVKINNKKYLLEKTNDVEKRNEIVKELLSRELVFYEETMTIEEYLYHTWDKESSKIALDIIGYYLSKMPNQDGKTDLEVLNEHQEKEMTTGIRYTTKSKNKLTEFDLDSLGLTREQVEKNPKKRYNVYVKSSAVHYDDMSLEEKISTGLAEVEETD